jgi:hypothetical protein
VDSRRPRPRRVRYLSARMSSRICHALASSTPTASILVELLRAYSNKVYLTDQYTDLRKRLQALPVRLTKPDPAGQTRRWKRRLDRAEIDEIIAKYQSGVSTNRLVAETIWRSAPSRHCSGPMASHCAVRVSPTTRQEKPQTCTPPAAHSPGSLTTSAASPR